MRNTNIIFSLFLLVIGFSVFMAPTKAGAYYGSYYQPYYDIPSYSTDYPGYHGYRHSSYPMDNSYITPRVNNSYQATYPKIVNNYSYNYNYRYNFYNAPVYNTSDVVYPNNNYRANTNTNYQNNNGYYNNNESCYGYGC